jgi:NTE family protein
MAGHRRKLGLALGGGSARGWSHVGVLRALTEMGLHPDVVAGTSAGALVGAAFVLGKLEDFASWLDSLERRDFLGYFDFTLSGGFLKGQKLFDFFANHVEDQLIEQLPIPFGTVATDLSDGTEIWLRSGSLRTAIRASVSIPALLQPVEVDGRWCIDGSLSNPVPVSLCRALGAEIVIAVDVNGGLLGQERPMAVHATDGEETEPPLPSSPTLLEVAERSLFIVQARLTRPRLAVDPPDVLITPGVGQIGFLDFHRNVESFEAGRKSVEKVAEEIGRLVTDK